MKLFCCLIFCFNIITAFSQTGRILQVDVVQVENNNVEEALYYYNHNWKAYREKMIAKGFIESYRLMQVLPDSSHPLQLILETVYADQSQFALSEPRWQQIFKEVNPGGTRLLNEKKATDFRKIIFSSTSEIMAEHALQQRK